MPLCKQGGLTIIANAMQEPIPWNIVETWLLQLICAMADFEKNGLSHNDIKLVSSSACRPDDANLMFLGLRGSVCDSNPCCRGY